MEPIAKDLERKDKLNPEIFICYGLAAEHFQAARRDASQYFVHFETALETYARAANKQSLTLLWFRSLAMADILYYRSRFLIELSKAPGLFDEARRKTANHKLLALYDVMQDRHWEKVTFANYLEELERRLAAFETLKSRDAPHWAACALRSILNHLAQVLLGVFYGERPADWELQLSKALGAPWKEWIAAGIPEWQRQATRRPDEIQFEIARILCGQTLQETLNGERPRSFEPALAAMELAESLFAKTLNDKSFSTIDTSDSPELSIMTCKFTHERVKLFQAMKLRDRSLAEFEKWREKIRALSGVAEEYDEYKYCRDQWLSLVESPREKDEILKRLQFTPHKKD